MRNIVLPAVSSTGSIRPVPARLMTTEAIRWAHNTVAKMALHFLNRVSAATKFPFATAVNGERVFIDETTPLYYEIDDNTVKQFFRQLGLDPDAEVSHSAEVMTADTDAPAIEIVLPLF